MVVIKRGCREVPWFTKKMVVIVRCVLERERERVLGVQSAGMG